MSGLIEQLQVWAAGDYRGTEDSSEQTCSNHICPSVVSQQFHFRLVYMLLFIIFNTAKFTAASPYYRINKINYCNRGKELS